MSHQMMFGDLFSATSSPESASGQQPSEQPVGTIPEQSGRDHAHANLSARRASEEGRTTSGTYGPTGTGSISQCRPPVVVGEQVASKDGLRWLDLVSADFEGEGYAIGASDLCAAGFGVDWGSTSWKQWLQRAVRDCPDSVVGGWLRHFAEWADQGLVVGGHHIRQRLYFVALADPAEFGRKMAVLEQRHGDAPAGLGQANELRGVADANGGDTGPERQQRGGEHGLQPEDGSLGGPRDPGERDPAGGALGTGAADRRWTTPDWIFCRDGSWRPVESRTSPLVNAAPGRVGKLRAYGNCIDFETATGFVEVVIDLVNEQLGG